MVPVQLRPRGLAIPLCGPSSFAPSRPRAARVRCDASPSSSVPIPSDSRLWASFMQANSSPPAPLAPSSPPLVSSRPPHFQKFCFHAQPSCKVPNPPIPLSPIPILLSPQRVKPLLFLQVQVAVSKASSDSFAIEILVDTGHALPQSNEPLKLHWVSICPTLQALWECHSNLMLEFDMGIVRSMLAGAV